MEFRDCTRGYSHLLAPSYSGERTDRVVQTVWWDNKMKHPTTHPHSDERFNINQVRA
jgi:hypothetical protein